MSRKKENEHFGYYKRLQVGRHNEKRMTVGKIYEIVQEPDGTLSTTDDQGKQFRVISKGCNPWPNFWEPYGVMSEEPAVAEPSFKVGDLIIGINDDYHWTGKGSICRVVELDKSGFIYVTAEKSSAPDFTGDKTTAFLVESKYFTLLPPAENADKPACGEYIGKFKRIGNSGSLYTQGKEYEVFQCIPQQPGFRMIQCDKGDMNFQGWSETNWQVCIPEKNKKPEPTSTNHPQFTTEEVHTMKIENAVLINRVPLDAYSDDDILDFIKEEKYAIQSLKNYGIESESKSLRLRIQQHETNIKQLIELLDTRVPVESAPAA